MKGKRIRELGGIVPQMHHPNNRFKKKKKSQDKESEVEEINNKIIQHELPD